MEQILNKLSRSIDTYTVFEENQVLTSSQLNRITEYLDRQHRLTRVKLFGIGIVCGLDANAANGSIVVSKGCAVTSDGDLLSYDQDRIFTSFKPYEDENAKYPVLRPNDTLLTMYELMTGEDGSPITNFQAETGSALPDMAIVLYLESYLFDPDLCTGGECDNKGKEQRNQLKALLISKSDIPHVFKEEPPFARRFTSLEPFAMQRVLLNPGSVDDYNELAQQYRNAVTSTIKNLKGVLKSTFNEMLRPLLEMLYQNSDPTEKWIAVLDKLASQVQSSSAGIQYVHDFLADVVTTYNEFREALFEDNLVCCPDITVFPKHVLIGPLMKNDVNPTTILRHRFYESPVLNLKSSNLQRARFLHLRIDQMMTRFAIPKAAETIKITPSRTACGLLGTRAIPYYYKIDPAQPLNDYWSYDHTIRHQQDFICSYNADQYNARPQALNPLGFSICEHDFFRIEGHLGMNVDEAEDQINKLIRQFNLPFKLLTLQIETALPPIKVRPWFGLKDLKVLHYLHRQDLGRTLGNLKSFSLKLNDTIQKADELPGKEIGSETLSYKGFIDDSTKDLEAAINTVGNSLKVPYTQFSYAAFRTNYNGALTKASGVNKSIKGITYASAFTPYEKIVNDGKFKWLEWIDGVLQKRKKKAEELAIFDKLLAEEPAMEHHAGVERGGTFILVFSASSKKVVADFGLPYWYYDVPAEEEAEEDVVEVDVKDDWVGLNDLVVQVSKEKLLQTNFDLLKQNVDNLQVKVNAQETSLKVYSGSLNTYTDTIFKTTKPGIDVGIYEGVFTDKALGDQAAIINYASDYIQKVDDKIKDGTATPQEKEIKVNMEAMTNDIIKNTMSEFVSKERDILPGSQEEKFIETATTSMAKITDSTVKRNLSKDIQTLQQNVGDKAILSNKMNNFIIR